MRTMDRLQKIIHWGNYITGIQTNNFHLGAHTGKNSQFNIMGTGIFSKILGTQPNI